MIKAVLVYVMCAGGVNEKREFVQNVNCTSIVRKYYNSMEKCEKEATSVTRDTDYAEKKVTVTTRKDMQGCIDISERVIKKEVYKMVKEK